MKQEELLEFMPHRGCNVLIDAFADTGEGSGEGRLTISEADPAGRDLFLARAENGPRVSHFFLVEHAALASLLLIREEMAGGRLAYFSTVSRYTRLGDVPAGTAVVSSVTRGRDRAGFRAFHADLATEGGDPVLTVDFMAFLAPRGEQPPAAPEAVLEPVPPRADLIPCLDPALAFLGGPDLDRGVYPPDHPLTPGHFPGSPTMMGMTQWLAVAERAALQAEPGRSEIRGTGSVSTLDGRPVVEVTGLAVWMVKDDDGKVVDLCPLATKRVAFRERIMAGEGYRVTFEPA